MKKRLLTCVVGLFAIFLAVGSFWPYQQSAWEWRQIRSALRSAGYSLSDTTPFQMSEIISLPGLSSWCSALLKVTRLSSWRPISV